MMGSLRATSSMQDRGWEYVQFQTKRHNTCTASKLPINAVEVATAAKPAATRWDEGHGPFVFSWEEAAEDTQRSQAKWDSSGTLERRAGRAEGKADLPRAAPRPMKALSIRNSRSGDPQTG